MMHTSRFLAFVLASLFASQAAAATAQQRGRSAIMRHGCAVCHVIPGIDSPGGNIGPPLKGIAKRSYIAGTLPNNLDNLERWIRDPAHVKRGTAMPDTGVSEQEARDISAYLYAQ